jgi:hypothetical protein
MTHPARDWIALPEPVHVVLMTDVRAEASDDVEKRLDVAVGNAKQSLAKQMAGFVVVMWGQNGDLTTNLFNHERSPFVPGVIPAIVGDAVRQFNWRADMRAMLRNEI